MKAFKLESLDAKPKMKARADIPIPCIKCNDPQILRYLEMYSALNVKRLS